MEKGKRKNNFSLAVGRKAIGAIVLFLFLGIFLAQIPDNFSINYKFSISPSFASAAAASTPAPAASPTPAAPDLLKAGGNAIIGMVANILSIIVGGLVDIVGNILVLLMKGVVFVAKYNDFTTATPVTIGWAIVRDLCNMFFILILLVIAFATILRQEGYDIKRMVPTLIIMAILINFSKTICGLIIDFAQVVMNAFISPIDSIGDISLTTMLGLNQLMSFAVGGKAADSWSIFAAYGFALIYSLIAAVVLVVIFAVLIVRIVMIWIYVVLSPLPYLLSTIPQGKSYVNKWWSDFTQNVVAGPVLAFFLWLSLTSLGSYTAPGTTLLSNNTPTANLIAGMPPALTNGMGLDQLIRFSIAIGMLIGGLIITQEAGGQIGQIAGKGMAAIQSGVKLGRRAVGGVGNLAVGQLAGETKVGKAVRGQLTNLASTGGIAARLGVSGLATRGLIGLEQRKKAYKDQAEKFVGNIKDERILARYANGSAITPFQMSVKDAIRSKTPSAIKDLDAAQRQVNTMDKDQVGKIGDREWVRMGQRGITLTAGSRALAHLEKNADERGAYNYGLALAHDAANPNANPVDRVVGANGVDAANFLHFIQNRIVGTDRQGNSMDVVGDRQVFGNLPGWTNSGGTIAASPDRVDQLSGAGRYANRYREVPEDWNKARGAGNLSVDSFSRGESNVIAADFDKIGLESIKEPDKKFEQVKGVHLTDSAIINDVAKKMVGVIDQEISRVKAGPQNPGAAARLNSLQQARAKFSEPQKIAKLDLVNSSSAGYRGEDLQRTVVHEQLHSYGVENENDTEQMAQYAIDTRQRGKVAELAKEYAAGGNIADIVSRQKPAAAARGVEQVSAAVAEADPAEIARAEAGQPAVAEPSSFVPDAESRTIINNISTGKSALDQSSLLEVAASLKRLASSIRRQTTTLGKRDRALADLAEVKAIAPTPLEVGFRAEAIGENFEV